MDRNIIPHNFVITTQEMRLTSSPNTSVRSVFPHCIWLTGLSGSGKSTIADTTNSFMFIRGYKSVVLDGDMLRNGVCSDLKFSKDSRLENIRRAAHIAKMFVDTGHIVFASFITPEEEHQQLVREILKEDVSICHVSTPIEVCEERDPKGLYKKARAGIIPEFTGVSAHYHTPVDPELNIDSSSTLLYKTNENLFKYLCDRSL